MLQRRVVPLDANKPVIIYIGRHGDHEWSIDGLEVLNPLHHVAGVVRHAFTLRTCKVENFERHGNSRFTSLPWRRSCPYRLMRAASSSEPPASVGLACRPVGAWRRHLVKLVQRNPASRQSAERFNSQPTLRAGSDPPTLVMSRVTAHRELISGSGQADLQLLARLFDRVAHSEQGPGAFGNADAWIDDAIVRALSIVERAGLDIRLVSHGRIHDSNRAIAERFNG